ncbi:MAG: ATP-binding protein [Roseobacter sp.]
MSNLTRPNWKKLILPTLVATLGLFVIGALSLNVSRDLKILNSASSDNVQWTLSQSEVEFLEFDNHLTEELLEFEPDLRKLRRDFDIFYSRINTLSESRLYSNLRLSSDFSVNLARVQQFLTEALPIIDAHDDKMTSDLPELKVLTTMARPYTRALSNSALSYFANNSDQRRHDVSETLTRLTYAVGILMLILLLLSLYLGALNAQNVRRRKEIAQTSNRMKIVTSTSLDAVIVSNDHGYILDFNAAAETIFGHKAADVIGQDLGALIVPEHYRDGHHTGMERVRQNGDKRIVGNGRVKLEALRANGDVFPVELAIQSAETEDGEIFIAFLRDISRRVQGEAELIKARDLAVAGEKAKTDFLATMSHEIRTPLNGLLGNLALFEDTKLNAKQKQFVKNMNTSGRLLMTHISDVLDITKYDAGKLKLRPVSMNLSSLLQDIIDSQSGAALANNTVLEWNWIADPVAWIHADRERIQHILLNMIGNAVKFTRDGRISVQAEVTYSTSNDANVHISVRDTGIGIEQDIQEMIFDDFVTGDSSYDRDVGGTGLGLGIARRFVEALDGQIGMESTKGEGSLFWVNFPITPISEPVEVSTPLKPADANTSCNILIVEDNLINRHVVREMLFRSGHLVTEAHDGRQGVAIANREHFDLILMDISMPVMDGRTATKAIRNGCGPCVKTPIVALTANALAEEQVTYLSDGMNDVLTKPLSRATLNYVLDTWAYGTKAAPPPVATDHIAELRDTVGIEAFGSLLERFTTDIEDLMKWLSDVANHNLEDIKERVHKTAGSAAAIGATDLRAALLEIEKNAIPDQGEQLADTCNRLPHVWHLTREWLILERAR